MRHEITERQEFIGGNLRNVTLKDMAKKNHRSRQEQVRLLLEREAKLARGDVLEQARKCRKKLAGRQFSDVVAIIREDRER